MRDIKFRGKRIDNGEWVYGLFARHKIGSLICPCIQVECEWDSGDYIEYIEVNGETVGQYTGFKDKNSKEIYEDDLFKSGISIGVIKFVDGQYLIIWRGHTSMNNLLYVHAPHGEVVGNIHDEVRSWGRNERQSKTPQESKETS